MAKDLFDTLSSIRPVSLELQSVIGKQMKHKVIKKNEVILVPGNVSKTIYFIINGLLRAYYLKDGVEISAWIKAEGEFVVSIGSFYPQVQSYEAIHALEDTEVFYISHDTLFELYDRYLEFSYIGLKLTIPVLVEWDERLFSLQGTNADERFKWFMKKKESLLERVPQKYIASYLNMTPETLSRARSKYFKSA